MSHKTRALLSQIKWTSDLRKLELCGLVAMLSEKDQGTSFQN